MNDCLFCKIIKGEVPSYTVYEDDLVKAFLDIAPSTNGDLLIIPKEHFENIMDINDEIIAHIFKVAKKLYPILKEKLGCKGMTLVQNNELGQDIKHFHLHLTPRYDNDLLAHNFNKISLLNVETVFDKLK